MVHWLYSWAGWLAGVLRNGKKEVLNLRELLYSEQATVHEKKKIWNAVGANGRDWISIFELPEEEEILGGGEENSESCWKIFKQSEIHTRTLASSYIIAVISSSVCLPPEYLK